MSRLLGLPPDFADAYRILNSAGIFPNVQDAVPLNLGAFQTQILPQGYKLTDPGNPAQAFQQKLDDTPLYLVNEDFLKLYVEYAKKDKAGNKTSDGVLNFGFDASPGAAKSWLSKLDDIAMVVDLGPMKRLMMIKGKFNAEKGGAPGFVEPQLDFSDELKPVIDILEILLKLQGDDYADAMKSGLEIAMSNAADSWNYAFHARKEIPLIRFPPGEAYNGAQVPLKLECHFAVGVYFNEALKITDDPKQLIPSVGAFLEFGGRLSVMCLSVAAATVYATGSVDLRHVGRHQDRPASRHEVRLRRRDRRRPAGGRQRVAALHGRYRDRPGQQPDHGLGLPAVPRLRRTARRHRQHHDPDRGQGLGAARLAGPGRTDLIAQVTFAIDISIFLVINLHFSQSWEEARQIA